MLICFDAALIAENAAFLITLPDGGCSVSIFDITSRVGLGLIHFNCAIIFYVLKYIGINIKYSSRYHKVQPKHLI